MTDFEDNFVLYSETKVALIRLSSVEQTETAVAAQTDNP